jgi:hypothetical protein
LRGRLYVSFDRKLRRRRRKWNGFKRRLSSRRLQGRELPPRDAFEIVVAKYKEDVGWAASVERNVTIYSKSGDSPYIELPNIGREAGTYLYHMVDRYDDLADRTLFVQGAPHDHELLCWPYYCFSEGPFCGVISDERAFSEEHVWKCDDNRRSHRSKHTGDPRNKMRIEARTKAALWDRFVGGPHPKYLRYGWGAQFSATRELIHGVGKYRLREMHELTQQEKVAIGDEVLDNYKLCVLFEMFWPYLLGAHRHSKDYR